MITIYIVRELSPFNLILRMARMDPNGLRHGVPDRAGKDLARVWNTSSTASPGHFWRKKRCEARNPKLDTVWCAATLGLVVKTKTSNKRQ